MRRDGRGTRTLRLKRVAAAVSVAFLSSGTLQPIYAAPVGGKLISGEATILQSGAQTIIVQTSARAAFSWQSFNVAANESVIYRQPSATSVFLNNISGPASVIYGTIQANGQVFLVNPAGITFARGATIDVAGLVASTLSISKADFMAGNYAFTGGGSAGKLTNDAIITAAKGGYVALLGKDVTNTGSITAANGSVALAAGKSMVLDFNGDGLLTLKVDAATANARVEHTGKIYADGGLVIMTAQSKKALLDTVLNVEGLVQAHGFAEREGHIYLDGGTSGVTRVAGKLDASSADAKGGEVKVLGEYVGLFDKAVINASGATGGGTVLIGGDYQGKNADITNALQTYVSADAKIKADATANGDGGKVIVWADDTTRFYGRVTARGGPNGGNGGFVETSGKAMIDIGGSVDASAPKGRAGQWLLDPSFNTTISNTPTVNVADFGATALGANVQASTIQTALDTGTSVTVATGTGGPERGDITIDNPVDIHKTAGGSATLTLQSAGSIIMQAGSKIRSTGGANALNVVFNADRDGDGVGGIQMRGNSRIVTNDGNVVFGGGSDPLSTATGSLRNDIGIDIAPNALVRSDAGSISMRGAAPGRGRGDSAGILLEGTLRSSTGAISLYGTGGARSGADIGIDIRGGVIRSRSGAITLVGTGGTRGDFNLGISILGSGGSFGGSTAGVILSRRGDITLIGRGGNGANDNSGVYFIGAEVGTQRGQINITGYGGAGDSGNAGVALLGSSVHADDGGLCIAGFGGNGTGLGNVGAVFSGNLITGRVVKIAGTGGGGLFGNDGVFDFDLGLGPFGASVFFAQDSLTIAGKGGGGSPLGSAGVRLDGSGLAALFGEILLRSVADTGVIDNSVVFAGNLRISQEVADSALCDCLPTAMASAPLLFPTDGPLSAAYQLLKAPPNVSDANPTLDGDAPPGAAPPESCSASGPGLSCN